jgi:hypothetical protein
MNNMHSSATTGLPIALAAALAIVFLTIESKAADSAATPQTKRITPESSIPNSTDPNRANTGSTFNELSPSAIPPPVAPRPQIPPEKQDALPPPE